MTLASIGATPVKTVIDSHWHFDHTDNNGSLHAAGASILAHANTQKRMSESHTLAVLGMHFPPSPVGARPQQIFQQTHKLSANGQSLLLTHLAPAHTDTDISIHFQEANVLHTGDVFFNGFFPYIDQGTGGSLAGMIASSGKLLTMVDSGTKIVPGHGALGSKADLAKFHDMLTNVQTRFQKLKSAGKSLQEAVAAKPLADLDPVWGKGNFNGDAFVQIAYPTV
jgi:glyoxylase-like metal-dependent hydrolase (beta-lactamase superfamily II)